MILPPEAAPLLTLFAAEFTAPTAARFHTLLAAALLTTGRRTVAGHTGRTVHGKARHRDPVRSSHAFTAWRYGHKWVVLAVLVKFLFAKRH